MDLKQFLDSDEYKHFLEHREEAENYWKKVMLPEKWQNVDYETRLVCTEYVFNAIMDHATEGGSYRYLIYDRLGFDMDAYGSLMAGLDISNEFVIGEPLPEEDLSKWFFELCQKVPAYLSEEDKKDFNFNEDRGLFFEFYGKFKSINEELQKQKEKYERLKDEYIELLTKNE